MGVPTTYAELQDEVQDYLHRGSTLALKAPNFIAYAEAKLNRRLRLREQITATTVSTSTSTRYATLPTGFAEAIELTLRIDTYPHRLNLISNDRMAVIQEGTTQTGQPAAYAINQQFEFDTISDQVYTCDFTYYKRWNIASDSTNWLLTNAPDAYLYGALLEAQPYMKNDQRIPVWASMFKSVIAELNSLDNRSSGPITASVAEVASLNSIGGPTFNIFTDS